MRVAPLWTVADCRPSNVDKKSVDGQQAVRLCNYTDVYNSKFIDADMDLMEGTAPPDQVERFQVRPGDVLMTKDSESNEDIGIPSLVRTVEPGMVCGYHLTLLRPDTKTLDPSYLYWWLESRETKDFWYTNSFGVTRFSLVSPSVWRLPVRLPDLVEQRRISAFLDRETAEIDAMDAELDRLVDTLSERGKAIIESVLVDDFKDGALKPLWSLLKPVKDQGHPTEAVLSVYRDYGVILKDSRDDNFNRTPENVSSYQLVRPGDVVINKMKAWQGSLGVSSHRGIISPDYQVCRPVGTEVDPQYLHLVLRSPQMIPQYGVRSKGIRPAQWRLYWEDMAHLTIPVPPLPEQRRIAAELDEQTSRIDDMVADASQLNTLLAERRATLITEVVTGTKEVPA